MTKIVAGKYYGTRRDGSLVEIDHPGREPDVWVCRRLADFPGGAPPKNCATASCCLCGAVVVYNPAKKVQAPKSCMQCNAIKPDPLS